LCFKRIYLDGAKGIPQKSNDQRGLRITRILPNFRART
jgi:hypothetical protein